MYTKTNEVQIPNPQFPRNSVKNNYFGKYFSISKELYLLYNLNKNFF